MAVNGNSCAHRPSGTKFNPAKWDDEKTVILLEVIELEIIVGNRPGGVFSKKGWKSLVSKFNEKTGLNLNKHQIKNKQDNLRREFTKWESLIGKETGLGWDHERRTLAALDEWWADKAKVDPSILRYKEAAPIYLELLQKIYGGVTATGYKAYVSTHPDLENAETENLDDVLADKEISLEDADEAYDTPVDLFSDFDVQPVVDTTTSTNKLGARKRKRQSSSIKISTTDRICDSIDFFSQTMKFNIEAIQSKRKCDDFDLSYIEALDMLRGILGMGPENPMYWKRVRVLEDKIRRIAFGHVIQDGVQAVHAWLATFPDFV